jgi:nicotinamidase/pyrazinamidase
VPVVNELARRFANGVLTQDLHPAEHHSFASSHPATKPFDVVARDYGNQILWPDHCVQDSHGARLHRDLEVAHAQRVLQGLSRAHRDTQGSLAAAWEKSRERRLRRVMV